MKNTIALILAAGKGTRMKSKFPKVLHKVGGVPMVEQVLRAVKAAGTQRQVVVVGFGGETVRDYLGDQAETVMQKEQLGTGHAVLQAEPLLRGSWHPPRHLWRYAAGHKGNVYSPYQLS